MYCNQDMLGQSRHAAITRRAVDATVIRLIRRCVARWPILSCVEIVSALTGYSYLSSLTCKLHGQSTDPEAVVAFVSTGAIDSCLPLLR
jgi:hypothetical protein